MEINNRELEHAVHDRRGALVPAPAARAVLQLVDVTAAELIKRTHLYVSNVLPAIHLGQSRGDLRKPLRGIGTVARAQLDCAALELGRPGVAVELDPVVPARFVEQRVFGEVRHGRTVLRA
ncbi:hypothetical protein [Variovorax paradoxus]|uniref:hypothetical protein n=1 Tax=Variovorax paradoxus TaxID=34073 RepID=UPI0030CEEAC7